MRRPDLCGAQARLQHSPPHSGTPPVPPSTTAPQANPATVHPVAPGTEGILQIPTVAPAALLQSPPQHSTLATHASPFCAQNEPFEQKPLLQTLEQQSPWLEHALPVVRHVGFSGAQVPAASQVALQHCAELVQGWLSETHCEPPQVPLSQTSVQHSWRLAQGLPPERQLPPSLPPTPPTPPAPPAPLVPPVLASGPIPPAPPAEIPSTSPPPQAGARRAPARAPMAVIVSRFLTLRSFAWTPSGSQLASAA
jgi:hypothetical protein